MLLADIFENFRQSCLKNYELDPAHFVSLPGLAWQVCLKKTNVELELLTDYDMLLMVEEGIRGGICHAMQRYAKANNKYMKDYDRKKKSSYIQYLDPNNLYGKPMAEKLPVRGFNWVNDISKIDEDFVKDYNKNDNKGYILEVDVDYPNKLQNLHSDLPFLSERMVINNTKKTKGTKKCVVNKMSRFEGYKKCLFSNGKVLKSQLRFKSENHEVYTENINKIALSCDDDKRIVTSDRITSYPYGYILKNYAIV